MKILDWIQGKKLKLETMEIEERDDLVIMPAWQFALLVEDYQELKRSLITYLVMFLAVLGFCLWLIWIQQKNIRNRGERLTSELHLASSVLLAKG